MRKNGVASTLEAGVIAKYILGDPAAHAWVAGCVLSTDFIKGRPDVARRFTAAWEKAVRLINDDPKAARRHLVKNTFTPDDVVDTVPLVKFTMVHELSAKDRADFQKFIDFSVQTGTISEKVEVKRFLHQF
jgi:NitT/TauT family transport system substrate-binding protein